MFELGRQANENPPKLKTFDAKGFAAISSSFIPPITSSWPRALQRSAGVDRGATTRHRRPHRRK
jgi:hypothetical protein